MKKFFIFIGEVLKLFQLPIILGFVWIWDIRPFTWLTEFEPQESILGLKGKVEENQLTPPLVGAIDVALLTFSVQVILLIAKKFIGKVLGIFLKKMSTLKASLLDIKTRRETLHIKFDLENKVNESLLVKGEYVPEISKEANKIYYQILFFLFERTDLVIDWAPRDISVEYDSFDEDKKVIQKKGEIKIPLTMLVSPNHQNEFNFKLKCALNNDRTTFTEVKVYLETNLNYIIFTMIFTKVFLSLNTVKLDKIKIVRTD